MRIRLKNHTQTGKGLHLHKWQKELLFYFSLLVVGMLLLKLPGGGEILLYDDSGSYMTTTKYIEGVMPVYPLYLQWNRLRFGSERFLEIVTTQQAFFATVCIMLFVGTVKKKFDLQYWMGYVCFLLALLPFTTELPAGMMTQAILTEGIAYAAFYLFMAAIFKAVWERSYLWLAASVCVTVFLASTRSQMQILYGICGLVLVCIMVGKAKKGTGQRVLFGMIGLIGCVVISLVGITLTGRTGSAYQRLTVRNAQKGMEELAAMVAQAEQAKLQESQEAPQEHTDTAEMAAAQEEQESAGADDSDRTAVQEKPEESQEPASTETETAQAAEAEQYVPVSQYLTLIYSRGMYEADAEDEALFQDEETRRVFRIMYEAVDEDQCRYAYIGTGLWAWKDVADGIGRVGNVGNLAQLYDYKETVQDAYDSNAYSVVRNEMQMEIGLTLLKEHFGRFVYHTLLMMPQAFISSVFFQIAPIYGICHLVTLFLYLSAIALMVWCFVEKRADKSKAAGMAVVLGINLVLIGMLSLLFFGYQRYLVYNFGIFYICYFVLLLEVWKIYGKSWSARWKEKARF